MNTSHENLFGWIGRCGGNHGRDLPDQSAAPHAAADLAIAIYTALTIVTVVGRQHSSLGRELDSLADVISFGVAPATLGFAAGMRGGFDWLILIFFVCCGVSRLARYNVTAENLSEGADKVAYFEGTPIPSSVLLTAALAFAAWQGRIGGALYGGVLGSGVWSLHPLTLLFMVSGTLMISKTVRIPKL